MPRIKDQAICVRREDWSQTSQLVVLLTQHHGLVRGLAKGSKRASPSAVARFSGGIELLTQGQVLAAVKPTQGLATITEWDLQQPYWHLRQSLAAQRLGLYGADLARSVLADHDPHPNVFTALGVFLDELADPASYGVALLRYQWRVLDDCGYQLQLDQDVVTGQPHDPGTGDRFDYDLDPLAGGFTRHEGPASPRISPRSNPQPFGRSAGSGRVSMSRPTRWRVGAATVRVLWAVSQGEDLSDWSRDPDAVRGANELLCRYAATILDRRLPAAAYLFQHPW